MKKLFALMGFFLVTLAIAYPAHAVCDQARLHVVRHDGSATAGAFQTYDFAPPASLPTFYYRYVTNDPRVIEQLDSAWVGHLTLRVLGNAASCPVAGGIRSGGVILYLYRDSFF